MIVARYTEPMQKFFESNFGLKSRFNTFIEFEDYSADELEEILVGKCLNNDYGLSESVKGCLRVFLNSIVNSKEENFANGRMVRKLYEDLMMNHARSVFRITTPDKVDLRTIIDEDFIPTLDEDIKNIED